ncbi:3-hydroxyacyl-CoA dehydrogenase [Arthrobacter sp. StoSoilA2]|nr:3-hydroxyacyl-CoA dehydrogenase [Arthrobacter sp. StoSoilA2]
MGPASLAKLTGAVRAVHTQTIDALAIIGAGPAFCAGADLKKMTEATTAEQGADLARQGTEAFAEIAALPIPTFAFLNGLALGGGLELALHADYRTASATAGPIGLPEVRLGLIPGWGGLARTLELLGPQAAAQIVISDSFAGKNLSASSAHKLGLVDAILPAHDFLASSLNFAASVLAGDIAPVREQRNNDGWDSLNGVREKLHTRLQGSAPAPYRALDLLQAQRPDSVDGTGARYTDMRETTAKTFGELLISDEARASIYALQLTQSLGKRPAGRPEDPPLPVQSVGVIGAGLMASQLASVFAQQLGVPVLMTDISQERVDRALESIGSELNRKVQSGRLDPKLAETTRSLITGTTNKADFSGCDVVIEAVFEELALKRAVFGELESIVRSDTLLLTNTSALSVEQIGSRLAHPERLVGFHFFNPVAVLPLVEIVTTPQTRDSALSTAFELAKRLSKIPVLTTDSAGFVVNRVLTRLLCEVLTRIDTGMDPAVIDHALDPLGLPMTPLQLLQFIGPTVQLHICERLRSVYPDRFPHMGTLTAVVKAGLPGFLDENGGISPDAAALLPPARHADPELVRGQILGGLAEEVEHMLREGVVAGPEQIDLCMILGGNYPFHTGGLTPMLDRSCNTAFHSGLRVPLPPRADLEEYQKQG